jgi:hypothetical protein
MLWVYILLINLERVYRKPRIDILRILNDLYDFK